MIFERRLNRALQILEHNISDDIPEDPMDAVDYAADVVKGRLPRDVEEKIRKHKIAWMKYRKIILGEERETS